MLLNVDLKICSLVGIVQYNYTNKHYPPCNNKKNTSHLPPPYRCREGFDQVNWSYMTAKLEKCNYPSGSIMAIFFLYTDHYACIRVKGVLSDPFHVKNRKWQGRTLSPVLFILVMEHLSKKSHNPQIYKV